MASRAPNIPLPNHDSTQDLLVRGRGGDRSAVNELFRRSLPSLKRWAHGRLPAAARDRGDTEDLLQDTFVAVLQRLSYFDAGRSGALEGYVRVALRNRVRDEIRRVSRRPPSEELIEARDVRPSPLDGVLFEDTADRYRAALERLRPVERAAILAFVEHGPDYRKLAEILGKPTPDAARMALGRAMRLLFQIAEGRPLPPKRSRR
jgi:RNA polymerase sigma factor (sigma-70 family)